MTQFSTLRRFAAMLAVLGLLSACETMETLNPFSEAVYYGCPTISIPKDVSFIQQFQDDSRDLSDMISDGGVRVASSFCEWDVDSETLNGQMTMTITPSFKISRGAADKNARFEAEYFVIVTDAERNILTKNIFSIDAPFPPPITEFIYDDKPVQIQLPIKGQTDRDFQVFLGFQLSETQLKENRELLARRASGR